MNHPTYALLIRVPNGGPHHIQFRDHRFDLIGQYDQEGVPLNGQPSHQFADKIDFGKLFDELPFHQIYRLES